MVIPVSKTTELITRHEVPNLFKCRFIFLGWAGLGWAGLGWAGLGWAGLGWGRYTQSIKTIDFFLCV
ncbi:hypothetical protein IE553_002043 [Salmonella enterica subsp. enterica serovar Montevideo]|uniref:Uncharacterized protein n=1 Tax=Salmonella enterica TaxID=28901 RepID=A0A760RBL5_SALER|nr:hypothetical protein [Salmonella enterica]ECQ6212125.1 hypothetical protein [Salmonella enterica subsp. enterica serovar Montevideo]ECL8347957.1 hypothetical protein [Salmonella enterica]ECQ6737822.1 hypothetical protein [Salmonella enterica subsp. enterica serovar Montevideo]ECY2265850.1 hypothetical protein [Salmonella enterica]